MSNSFLNASINHKETQHNEQQFSSVGVDKIIRIVLLTAGPMSPYIHERILEVSRQLQDIHDD